MNNTKATLCQVECYFGLTRTARHGLFRLHVSDTKCNGFQKLTTNSLPMLQNFVALWGEAQAPKGKGKLGPGHIAPPLPPPPSGPLPKPKGGQKLPLQLDERLPDAIETKQTPYVPGEIGVPAAEEDVLK